MAKEVERKFLVSSDEWRDMVGPGTFMSQFYLVAEPDRSVRVRIRQGAAPVLTLKLGLDGLARDEFEYELSIADAEAMRSHMRGSVVEKTRFEVSHGAHIYEVDVFGGSLDGLVVAELETPDDVAQADLPSWLGREVTGQAAYYNASLAMRGLPETPA